LTSLDADDPDKGIDPGDPQIFWSDGDGKPANVLSATHLTSRACVVTDAFWDGTAMILTISRP